MSAMIWDSAAQAFAEPQNVPKRYDAGSGAYVDTTGKAFDHDAEAWVEKWSPNKVLYLYNEGDECTDVTGGWTTTYETWQGGSAWAGNGSTIAKGTVSMTLIVNASERYSSGSIVTVRPIDLTDCNTLYVDVGKLLYDGSPDMYANTCNAHTYLGVSQIQNEYVYGDYVKSTGAARWIRVIGTYVYENKQNSVIEMDISSLTGSYYVFGIMAHGVCDTSPGQKEIRTTVNAVWLE